MRIARMILSVILLLFCVNLTRAEKNAHLQYPWTGETALIVGEYLAVEEQLKPENFKSSTMQYTNQPIPQAAMAITAELRPLEPSIITPAQVRVVVHDRLRFFPKFYRNHTIGLMGTVSGNTLLRGGHQIHGTFSTALNWIHKGYDPAVMLETIGQAFSMTDGPFLTIPGGEMLSPIGASIGINKDLGEAIRSVTITRQTQELFELPSGITDLTYFSDIDKTEASLQIQGSGPTGSEVYGQGGWNLRNTPGMAKSTRWVDYHLRDIAIRPGERFEKYQHTIYSVNIKEKFGSASSIHSTMHSRGWTMRDFDGYVANRNIEAHGFKIHGYRPSNIHTSNLGNIQTFKNMRTQFQPLSSEYAAVRSPIQMKQSGLHSLNSLQYKLPTMMQYTPSVMQYKLPTMTQYKLPTITQYKLPTIMPYNPPTMMQYKPPTMMQYKPPTIRQYNFR